MKLKLNNNNIFLFDINLSFFFIFIKQLFEKFFFTSISVSLIGFLINIILQVLDVIVSSTNDLGPFSLDNFRKNLSASWRVGLGNSNAEHEVWKNYVLLQFCMELLIGNFKKLKTYFVMQMLNVINVLIFFVKAKPTNNTCQTRKARGEGRQIFRWYHTLSFNMPMLVLNLISNYFISLKLNIFHFHFISLSCILYLSSIPNTS